MMSIAMVADSVAVFGVESPTYAAIRFVQFSAVTILFGSLALAQIVLPRFARVARADATVVESIVTQALHWTRIALVVLAGATLARLAAQHIVYFEDASWSMSTMQPLLLLSGWGHAWLLAAAAILLGFLAHRLAHHKRRGSWLLLSVPAFALSWSLAMSGHAAAAQNPLLAMTLDALHVIAAGGWIGSLTMLMLIAVPTVLRASNDHRHQLVARLIAAFSPTALVFSFTLGVTGAVAGWRNVGSWQGLVGSTYGQLLLVKLGLVAVVAVAGAINWRRVLPRLGEPSATRTLQRSAKFELAAALVILVVTAVLVATPTPEFVVATSAP